MQATEACSPTLERRRVRSLQVLRLLRRYYLAWSPVQVGPQVAQDVLLVVRCLGGRTPPNSFAISSATPANYHTIMWERRQGSKSCHGEPAYVDQRRQMCTSCAATT